MSIETSPLVLAAQKYFQKEIKTAKVLEYFEMISSIPHVSHHESQLAAKIVEWAENQNLAAQIDDVGNVWIVKEPDLGYENATEIILQGHLDMVADKSEGNDFDFYKSGIPLEVTEDGFIKSSANTTLGADNGIGVAFAMAVLTDKSIKTGKITALFTVAEETGLEGAKKVVKEDLPSSGWLINLDSEGVTIGCAGGCTVNSQFKIKYEKDFIKGHAYKIELSGLPGGHSGCDINKNHGNAIIAMLTFLKNFPQLYIHNIAGGSLPNVIPSSSKVICIATEDILADLTKECTLYCQMLNKTIDVANNSISLTITPLEDKELRCLSREFFSQIIDVLLQIPDGVIAFNQKYNCVETSCNFASISIDNDVESINLWFHPRSMYNNDWMAIVEKITTLLNLLQATTDSLHGYSGWVPKEDSQLIEKVNTIFTKFGNTPYLEVTHGGLECGHFALLQPALDIISLGPDMIYDIHSYRERAHLKGIEDFWPILQEIVSCK